MDLIELVSVFVLRTGQAAALAMPTLLAGMLTAGVLRAVGGNAVRSWVSRGTWADLPKAFVFAAFLPVCAIGVLPVLVVLLTMRVRRASIVVVALASPLVTPWTLGYMADSAGLAGVSIILGSSVVIAALVGLAFERVRAIRGDGGFDTAPPSGSILLYVIREAGRSLTRGVATVAMLGVLGAGAVSLLIPPNAMGDWLVERSPLHAAMLSGIALVTYTSPERAAMQAGQVLFASTMPALVISMIVIGSAVHLGTLVAAVLTFGKRSALYGFVALVVSAVGPALLIDGVYHRPGVELEDTHAFEDYGRPFHLLDHPEGPLAGFIQRFTRPVGLPSVAAALGVVALLACRTLPIRNTSEKTTADSPAHRVAMKGRWVVVPTVTATLALTAYTYYPSPNNIKSEIRRLAAEYELSARKGDRDTALILINQIDRRLNQITIASALRARRLSSDQRSNISRAQHHVRKTIDELINHSTLTSSDASPATYAVVKKIDVE